MEDPATRCADCSVLSPVSKWTVSKLLTWETEMQVHHLTAAHTPGFPHVCLFANCFAVFKDEQTWSSHRLKCLAKSKNLPVEKLLTQSRSLCPLSLDQQLLMFKGLDFSWRDWDAERFVESLQSNEEVVDTFIPDDIRTKWGFDGSTLEQELKKKQKYSLAEIS